MPHTLRPGHPDTPFIIVSAYSISTLVKGPFTAGMQRAVALRSYHHSLRVPAVLTSLLSSLQEGAPTPLVPAYEESALCHAFDTHFSEEELRAVAAPDPAEAERLHQICQLGGERDEPLARTLVPPPCAQHEAHHPLTPHAPRSRARRAVA